MTTEPENRKNVSPFINVTPLIDVLLVLLIIFMVISPIKARKFEAKIPEKTDQETILTGLELVVTIGREGEYRLNTQPVGTLTDLESALHRALDGRPEALKAVFVKAPRSLRYGEVVKVIDVMKSAGSAPIGLQLEDLD